MITIMTLLKLAGLQLVVQYVVQKNRKSGVRARPIPGFALRALRRTNRGWIMYMAELMSCLHAQMAMTDYDFETQTQLIDCAVLKTMREHGLLHAFSCQWWA